MEDYRRIADQLAADITAGRLRPGERLLPQRRFARQHGIAGSTAARAYGELVRRGLAVGEVGRGTFVRAAPAGPEPALAEPGEARIDLELNFPMLPQQAEQLAAGLTRMSRPDVLATSMGAMGPAGTPAARETAASFLARAGWAPDPRRILFAGNGRQAIAAALAAYVPAGERLGVERLTYPVVKGIAARLGITLVPLAMDEHGLLPEAVAAALPLRAVYLQPAVHNPLGVTMPQERRVRLVETLRRADLHVIEDGIYSFLRDDLPPLAALAPERTILLDSLSKRLAPGLTLGFAVPPAGDGEQRVMSALRSGAWTASRFALTAATQWLADGTAAAIGEAKRLDARQRQRIRAERLAGFTVHADPNGYHCWWELPDPWRADTFVAAAARHGIAVAPGAAFAVGSGHAPNAVRLALGSPTHDTLADALDLLTGLARGAPEDAVPE
ncbi:PLP-dependent aminotransferase family protein [Micromonospora polyrhachis]|uniref:DNA-binding transcriptional MocR family regulator n=1 Tax=Micromonospora polyrhachis TaxID=1282883 RepID=A0A7W7SWP3_9ACTN|nr:PLP-dependent aminotransferase family protein [Micromonospora polyrhachis]MBB4962309.1 DNA-binding transcriptional MocR family regulator [Micromonospora polyrhachis]